MRMERWGIFREEVGTMEGGKSGMTYGEVNRSLEEWR